MKKYWKELAALMLQLALFYLVPLAAGPTDGIGLVVVLLAGTFALSALLGGCSGGLTRLAYPPVVAALFIPSIFLYYNHTAAVHALWYLVTAYAGIGLGALVRLLIRKLAK